MMTSLIYVPYAIGYFFASHHNVCETHTKIFFALVKKFYMKDFFLEPYTFISRRFYIPISGTDHRITTGAYPEYT